MGSPLPAENRSSSEAFLGKKFVCVSDVRKQKKKKKPQPIFVAWVLSLFVSLICGVYFRDVRDLAIGWL